MWKPWPSDELAGRPLPRLDAEGRGKPPPGLYVLRAFGLGSIVLIVVMTLATDPRPGLRGEGVAILLLLIAWLAGLAAAMLPLEQTSAVRGAGLAVVGATTVALMAFQPDSAAFAGIYFVVVLSAMTLPGPPALALSAATLAGELVVIAADGPHHSAGSAMGLTFGMIPWFLVIRLMRRLRQRSDDALALVEELRESRAAHAQSAALAERGRVARELHDVLAHSLSALALQLEGTRLMAADRGTDPQVVDAIHRAHHLAAAGLTEARQAIAALHGDALPGPERLPELADAFAEHAGATCTFVRAGAEREHGPEARLALYRTTQEALTNIRKHSAADRVAITLAEEADGTRLVIQDFGPGAPVAASLGGVLAGPGGYGLSGMRERAELLGGRLTADPTPDGFRVELWLPA